MACNFPKIYNGVLCPCGKCAGCVRSIRNVWTTRAILESYCHERNLFITLTYSPESYPESGCISKRELQLFIKRLRKKCGQFRYLCCGEYGRKTRRAHYHGILFGFNGSVSDLESCWGKGFVSVGTVTPASCAYICKYITKRYDAEWRTELSDHGLEPEFLLMSRRPGIGFDFVEKIVNGLNSRNIKSVPNVLRIGGRIMVLGRYLKTKIAELIGITDEQKAEKLKALRKELHDMLCDFYGVAPHPLSDYFPMAKDASKLFLKSLERPDREIFMKQRDYFIGKL